tara:strand:- start:2 stop:256 length:255 start_codon:yes stop_codon:yes gene_type:complete
LLTGSDCLIEANLLLRALLGTVAVAPDTEARDGLRIEIRSSVADCYLNKGEGWNAKGLPEEAYLFCSKISVVAGVGFEPTTFRL